jgi:hypothetical protein
MLGQDKIGGIQQGMLAADAPVVLASSSAAWCCGWCSRNAWLIKSIRRILIEGIPILISPAHLTHQMDPPLRPAACMREQDIRLGNLDAGVLCHLMAHHPACMACLPWHCEGGGHAAGFQAPLHAYQHPPHPPRSTMGDNKLAVQEVSQEQHSPRICRDENWRCTSHGRQIADQDYRPGLIRRRPLWLTCTLSSSMVMTV